MLHLSKLTQDDCKVDISRIHVNKNYILYQNCWRWIFFYYETRARALFVLVWFIRVLSIMINALKNKHCYRVLVYSIKRTRYPIELSLLKRRNVVLGNSLISVKDIHVKCLSNNKTHSSNVTKGNYAIHRINIIGGKSILYTCTYCLLNYNFFNVSLIKIWYSIKGKSVPKSQPCKILIHL